MRSYSGSRLRKCWDVSTSSWGAWSHLEKRKYNCWAFAKPRSNLAWIKRLKVKVSRADRNIWRKDKAKWIGCSRARRKSERTLNWSWSTEKNFVKARSWKR